LATNPEWAREHHLAHSGLPAVSHKKNTTVLFPHKKIFINQACLVKMAGYWPHFLFFCFIWISTLASGPSQSMIKNEALDPTGP